MSTAKASKGIWVIILLILLIVPGKPASGLDEPRTVYADEILAKIGKNEPVNYSNAIVLGNLNSASLPSEVIASPISLKDCKFQGAVGFNNTIMKGQVTFERSEFSRPVYFIQSKFMRGANFDSCRFSETAVFRGALLNQSADFEKARFHNFADFGDSHFAADVINFRGAYFYDIANFVSTKFDSENTVFEWSQFNKAAKFWHATFGEYANFRGTQFGDISDFYSVQFNDTADFWGAQFNKDIFFNDIGFKTFRVQWASIEGKLNCNGPPYLLLIKNFKDLEQFDDADNCYYQYRDWRRINRPLEFAKVTDYVAWLSCGYGVRWHHTILSSIVVMLLFGLYYESFSSRGMLRNLLNRDNNKDINKYIFKGNLKRAITFSALTLLSLPSDWFPFGKEEYAEFIRRHLVSAIFERIIGWGLMLLLIGTLSRLMVRY